MAAFERFTKTVTLRRMAAVFFVLSLILVFYSLFLLPKNHLLNAGLL